MQRDLCIVMRKAKEFQALAFLRGCDKPLLPRGCHLYRPLCHLSFSSLSLCHHIPITCLLHLLTWFTWVYMYIARSFQDSVTFWSSASHGGSHAPHMSAAHPRQSPVHWVTVPSQVSMCLTCSYQGNSFNIQWKIIIQHITTTAQLQAYK